MYLFFMALNNQKASSNTPHNGKNCYESSLKNFPSSQQTRKLKPSVVSSKQFNSNSSGQNSNIMHNKPGTSIFDKNFHQRRYSKLNITSNSNKQSNEFGVMGPSSSQNNDFTSSIISQSTFNAYGEYNWDDDEEDDQAMATLNFDAGVNEFSDNSFKENVVVDENATTRTKTHSSPSRDKPVQTSTSSTNLQSRKLLSLGPKNTNSLNKNTGSLEKELEEMKLKVTMKDGEVKILRQDLQKKDKIIFEKESKHQQEVELLKLEAEKKFNELKKEYDKIQTELQFQSRDIADSEDKMKAMRTIMKLTPGSPERKKHHNHSGRVLFKDDVKESANKVGLQETGLEPFPKLSAEIHFGKILCNIVYPPLFSPPESENELLVDQVENTKGVNVSTIKNVLSSTQSIMRTADSERTKTKNSSKIENSNQSSKLISFSQLPFIPLFTMKSLDTDAARDLVKKIFFKCLKLLEKFLHILRKSVKCDESYEKRVCKLATNFHSVTSATKNYSLFDPQRWYEDEKGIEIRRAIGVLSVLASTSVHAVNLALQSNFSESECNLAGLFLRNLSPPNLSEDEELMNCALECHTQLSRKRKLSLNASPPVESRKVPKLFHSEPSTSKMDVDQIPTRSTDSGAVETHLVAQKEDTESNIPSHCLKDEKKQKSICPVEKPSILSIILEIVTEIRVQYRTLSFNGVLAAVVLFLKTLVELDCDIPDKWLTIIYDIIKEIIYCTPGPTVIHEINFLMVPLVKYQTITNNLCINSAQDSFFDSLRHYTFTTSTCPLQVFCTECEMIEKTPLFVETFTKWALKLTLNVSDCPIWLSGGSECSTCDCFPRFIQLFLKILYSSIQIYEDDDNPVSKHNQQLLELTLKRGVIVLHSILLRRNDFLHQVGTWDGLYEAIIHHLVQISYKIHFDAPSYDILNDLSFMEQVEIPEDIQRECSETEVDELLDFCFSSDVPDDFIFHSREKNLQLGKNPINRKYKKKLLKNT